jgi:Protein of unknown function (DUF3180)
VNPTRPRGLVIAGALALVVSYILMRAYYLSLLTSALPRTPVLSVTIVALVEAELGRGVRARLAGRPGSKAIMPITVARYAALARASSIAGAAVVGAWAGVLLYTAPRGAQPSVAGADTITSSLGIGSGAALLAAALWLEQGCRQRRR